MKTFTVRTVSGGIHRQTFTIEAESLESAVEQLGPGAVIVERCPGWAFVHTGATTSASITWKESL